MILELVVFDLDYTIWEPEMYQINGPPKLTSITDTTAPSDPINDGRRQRRHKPRHYSKDVIHRSRSIQHESIVTDQSHVPVTIFDGALYALQQIRLLNSNNNDVRIQVAAASKTDEPEWANSCMKWLVVSEPSPQPDDAYESESEPESTTTTKPSPPQPPTLSQLFDHVEIHVRDKRFHFQNLHRTTGIPYNRMLFFDNEYGNIQSVKRLGVTCVYTPNGMTRENWEEGLAAFDLE